MITSDDNRCTRAICLGVLNDAIKLNSVVNRIHNCLDMNSAAMNMPGRQVTN